MVDMAHFSGLVAGKVFTGIFDPVPYAAVVTTTTHKTLRGPRGGMVLCTEEYGGAVDKGCPMVLGGPLPHVIGAKAVAFKEASEEGFKKYAHQVVANAKALAEALQVGGATVITGGTDNHLVLVDVAASFGISGMEAEKVLRAAGMTVNRNTIPFDPKGPWHTSGVRMGTPAITSRGMKESEMKVIGEAFCTLLKGRDAKVIEGVRGRIDVLLDQFPLYPEITI
jgi:glycine hydroxymethyltransferase